MSNQKKDIEKTKNNTTVKGKEVKQMKSQDYLKNIIQNGKELVKSYKISIKNSVVEDKINQAAIKYRPNMKIQGFRKGKATIDIVKKQYKKELESEVIEEITNSEVFKKINEEKIQSVGQPSIEKIDYKEDKGLKIDFKVEIFPEVKIDEIEKIKIEVKKQKLEYPEYKEDENIKQLLKSYSKYGMKKGAIIQDDDMVMLNIQSKNLDNNKKFPKNEEKFTVTKNNDYEILDLYKEIIGKKTNESVTINRKYPKNHSKRPWAGKEVEHEILIGKIFEIVERKLDATLFQEIGVKDQKELKEKLKNQYDESKNHFLKNTKTELILDYLCENIKFEIPHNMFEQYLENAKEQIEKIKKSTDKDKDKKMLDIYKDVHFSVKKAFIINYLKAEKKIKVEEKDLDEKIKEMSEKQGMSFSQFKKLINSNAQYKEQLENDLSSQKISDFLIANIKIKEV